MLQSLGTLIGPAHVNILQIQGRARFSAGHISAFYAGNGTNFAFLRDLFFSDFTERPILRLATPLRLAASLARLGRPDLWLTDLPPVWAALLPSIRDVSLPAWIRQELSLPSPHRASARLMPRLLEKEIRRCTRQSNYTVRFTSDPGTFRSFFHEYYRPYIHSRFGDAAVVVSEQAFLARCRAQELAQLFAGSEWVSGMLLSHRRSIVRFGWFGSNSNPPPPGSSETLDAACIQRGYQRGATKVVLGNSRPCLNDGVLRYKAKFGAHIVATRHPQARLGMKFLRLTDAVVQCLKRQPLITFSGSTALTLDIDTADDAPAVCRLVPLGESG